MSPFMKLFDAFNRVLSRIANHKGHQGFQERGERNGGREELGGLGRDNETIGCAPQYGCGWTVTEGNNFNPCSRATSTASTTSSVR